VRYHWTGSFCGLLFAGRLLRPLPSGAREASAGAASIIPDEGGSSGKASDIS
jgi:hypothetical protein